MLTALTVCQMDRPIRQAEDVPVPVEHLESMGQKGEQIRRPALIGQRDRKPADLPVSIRVYAGPQGSGDQLGTQADPDHSLTRGDGCAYQCFLVCHPGIVGLVPHPHGSTHDHQPIERLSIRQLPVFEQERGGNGIPLAGGPVIDPGGSLERDVLETMDTHTNSSEIPYISMGILFWPQMNANQRKLVAIG